MQSITTANSRNHVQPVKVVITFRRKRAVAGSDGPQRHNGLRSINPYTSRACGASSGVVCRADVESMKPSAMAAGTDTLSETRLDCLFATEVPAISLSLFDDLP